MLQKVRSELKAIDEWDRRFSVTAPIEALAVRIRAARKEELIRLMRAIVARN